MINDVNILRLDNCSYNPIKANLAKASDAKLQGLRSEKPHASQPPKDKVAREPFLLAQEGSFFAYKLLLKHNPRQTAC
jgi:hypothetical protein